jgi:hypothetical protein
MNCEYCLESFKTNDELAKHTKKCSKYKDVLFVCKKCKFSTSGITNIDKHILLCKEEIKEDNLSYELISDEEGEEENIQLKVLLRIEKKLDKYFKNNKIPKIISEMPAHFIFPEIKEKEKDKDKPVIINQKKRQKEETKKDLSEIENLDKIILKDEYSKIIEDISMCNNNTSLSQKSSPSLPGFKKNTYKQLKIANIELATEISADELETKVNIKKQEIEYKKNAYINIIKESEIIFKECFENIKQNRTYTKSLENIKKARLRLIECMPHNKYIKLLEGHVKILENIFKNSKEFPNRKIVDTISKSMNSIDMRLISYGSYLNTILEIDDIQRFKSSLKFFNECPSFFMPLDKEELFRKFFTYGTALFTIKDMIEMFVPNNYGFNNIIYVKLKSSSDEETDPYSFYILEDVNSAKKPEKRYWKMDCRLEEFSNNFIDNIKPYLIELFRRLYFSSFNDNEFRKDYATSSCITEYDCEQLLHGIHILSKPKEFNILLRNTIRKCCTYLPTMNDKFNLHGDDNVQKKRFAKIKEDEEQMVESVKMLFDNISTTDAVDFCRTL